MTPGIDWTTGASCWAMARGGRPEHARQLERHRDRQVAERAVGRHFDGKGRDLGDLEIAADRAR